MLSVFPFRDVSPLDFRRADAGLLLGPQQQIAMTPLLLNEVLQIVVNKPLTRLKKL